MRGSITNLRDLFLTILRAKGLSEEESNIVVQPFLKAELSGKRTHGITKFLVHCEAIAKREGKPEIVRAKFNYALIDANKEIGYLSVPFAINILVNKAKQYGNSIVAIKNSYYFGITGVYAEEIAKAGFIGIVQANGGPAAVTPFGGVDPIFGTNPIAIAIPTKNGPIVLDMATSKRTWGEINKAKVEGGLLPDQTYLDSEGVFTTDPNKVAAVLPFAEAKGSGLNLMIEIMTGAFVGAKMGLQTQNAYDLGFLLMAFSPDMFSTKDDFESEVERLVKEIKSSRKAPGVSEIYLPGEHSNQLYEMAQKSGEVDVEGETWKQLEQLSEGINVAQDRRLEA